MTKTNTSLCSPVPKKLSASESPSSLSPNQAKEDTVHTEVVNILNRPCKAPRHELDFCIGQSIPERHVTNPLEKDSAFKLLNYLYNFQVC